jgi:hypothetical protein
MKNTRLCNIHKKFSLQQALGKASKSWNVQGLHHRTPSHSSLIPEYGHFSNLFINRVPRSRIATSSVSRALTAICALSLLLFSCVSAVEGSANAQAHALHVLSVPSLAVKPTRTPPGRHSPTPVPTTPTPSPTLAVTLTTIPTALANATPPVLGTMSQAGGKRGDNPMPTSIPTQPTPSTTSTVWHTSSTQQKGNSSLLFVIIATLIGIGSVILLLVIGLSLLRKYLMPSTKVRLSPSGAPPWHRVKINSPDDHLSRSGHNLQALQTLDVSSPTSPDWMPTTDVSLPTINNVIPSRRTLSSITSNFAFKRNQLTLPAAHFLRPTKLKKMHKSSIVAEPENSPFNVTEQNQSGAVLREPWEEPYWEDTPSLDDPSLRETLEYYMLKGQIARQLSEACDQPEHGRC